MNFGGIIRGWYKKNKRDLPWRLTKDPYRVWLSEVILQQTRVDQGLDYYLELTGRFPDVASLARAGEDEVLKVWQGLGYYSRARNLHRAAKDVVANMEGRIPDTYEGLLKLAGVGEYTASAVASICFREPRATVDGNVARVIARIYGVEQPVNSREGNKIIAALALELLDREDPGTHNQAMMEFGALQCVPASPDCDSCPLESACEARNRNRVNRIPVKIPRRKPVERWIYFYVIYNKGETVLTKRGTDGIWKSLYQFPALESEKPLPPEAYPGILSEMLRGNPAGSGDLPVLEEPSDPDPDNGHFTITRISEPVKHQLTHRTLHATFIHVNADSWPSPLPGRWERVPVGQLGDFPVPRLINRYMEVAKI